MLSLLNFFIPVNKIAKHMSASTTKRIPKNTAEKLKILKTAMKGIRNIGSAIRALICCASFMPFTLEDITTTRPIVVRISRGESASISSHVALGNSATP